MRKRRGGFAGLTIMSFASLAATLFVAFSGAAVAADTGDAEIVVTFLSGNVAVTQQAQRGSVRAGTKLVLPASIRTGNDGTIELRQHRTTVTVAPNSTIDIPVTGLTSGKVDRVIQSSGSVFYRVEPRETQKLRVETPYLVAVIKGTQFNVVVQPGGATVALFEGSLQLDAPDNSDSIDLNAGEIAIRGAAQPRIRTLKMNTGETLRAQLVTPAGAIAQNAAAASAPTASVSADAKPAASVADAKSATANAAAGVTTDTNSKSVATNANVSATVGSANANIGATANVNSGLTGNASLGAGTPSVNSNAAAGVAGVNSGASLGSNVNLGTGGVGVGTTAGVSVGNANANPGLATTPSLGVATAIDTSATGGIAGVNASASLGSSPNLGTNNGTGNGTAVGNSISTPTGTISTGSNSVGVNGGPPLGVGGGAVATTPASTLSTIATAPAPVPPVATPIEPAPSPGNKKGGIVRGLGSIPGAH
jgi:hypothetical protein